MKKIISVFLTITFLVALAVIPAEAATGDVIINASDQNYTELVGTYTDAPYKAFVFGSSGQYVSYDVEIPSNAYY